MRGRNLPPPPSAQAVCPQFGGAEVPVCVLRDHRLAVLLVDAIRLAIQPRRAVLAVGTSEIRRPPDNAETPTPTVGLQRRDHPNQDALPSSGSVGGSVSPLIKVT